MKKNRIFISYSHKDIIFVKQLVDDLENAGLEIFYDQRIQPGESWANSLSAAIESAKYILVILSPDYLVSQWAQEELQFGLLRETEQKATVIPILIRPCKIPTFLVTKHYADFSKDYSHGLQRLLPVLVESKDEDVDATSPGRSSKDIDPDEIKLLRTELKKAVDLFKSKPSTAVTSFDAKIVIKGQKKRCFYVMPFNEEDIEVVYEDYAKPVIENDCNLECERGDDVFGSNVIMDDILSSIKNSDIIIADLTRKNANVFYEVGICHALNKQVLLLAQSIDEVPFDLRHRRVLLYDYSPRGCKRFEKSLKENLLAMLEKIK